MPNTTLSIDQIAAIKAFINKRGFNTIEVEMEALDHMASKVESLLEERPEMDFQLAINKAHASFGIFGLSSIEESVSGSIHNKLKKRFLKELWTYFSSKKVLLLISIYLVFSLGLNAISVDLPLKSLRLTWLVYGFSIGLIPYVFFTFKFRKWTKKSTTVHLAGMGFYITYFIFCQGMNFILTIDPLLTVHIILTTSMFTLLTISALISYSLMKWSLSYVEERYLKYA
jgi:hypothetical protein